MTYQPATPAEVDRLERVCQEYGNDVTYEADQVMSLVLRIRELERQLKAVPPSARMV